MPELLLVKEPFELFFGEFAFGLPLLAAFRPIGGVLPGDLNLLAFLRGEIGIDIGFVSKGDNAFIAQLIQSPKRFRRGGSTSCKTKRQCDCYK